MRAIDAKRVREITDELATIRLGRSFTDIVLPQVHELLGFEYTLLYSVRSVSGQWEIERWNGIGDKIIAAAKPVGRMLARAREFPLYYDPLHTPPDQRNRVIDALAWILDHAPNTWDSSPMCREVLAPLKLHRHHQPRALLSDGPCMLAWFGGMHPEPHTARQATLLGALVEPMRERLLVERRLFSAPDVHAALDVLLDRLGAPAFIVDTAGRIQASNASGHALLTDRRADVVRALADAVAGCANTLQFELIPVRSPGTPDSWIAVEKRDRRDARIDACIRSCEKQWRLTPRQAEVLALVTRGLANATIATTLGCVERTIELHVTALLDRAGVDSRAALVSVVLTAV